jgi:hypothetical protein
MNRTALKSGRRERRLAVVAGTDLTASGDLIFNQASPAFNELPMSELELRLS